MADPPPAAKMFAASFDLYSFGGVKMPRSKQYTIPSAISNAVTCVGLGREAKLAC